MYSSVPQTSRWLRQAVRLAVIGTGVLLAPLLGGCDTCDATMWSGDWQRCSGGRPEGVVTFRAPFDSNGATNRRVMVCFGADCASTNITPADFDADSQLTPRFRLVLNRWEVEFKLHPVGGIDGFATVRSGLSPSTNDDLSVEVLNVDDSTVLFKRSAPVDYRRNTIENECGDSYVCTSAHVDFES